MARHLTYLLAATLLVSTPALAQQLYKIVDKNGKVTFTDKKPSGDVNYEKLTVNAADPDPQAVQKARANKQRWQPQQKIDKPKRFRGYQSVSITHPSNDQSILHDQQRLAVKLALTPGLQPDHKAQLLYDGESFDEPSKNLNFVLTDLERGSHSIVVNIIDASGKTIASSNSVTIHVKRPIVRNGPLRAPGL
ncbi:DUF4124 domain-containing protein [Porticoccus sp. W117]|uniref:DUF4124 domain-containing protein n=1 Tax=Porticoccus sp. W117 TaxID=3054777 RepID=UPI0025965F2B|nr:DUF4124 domain-containing protein [Porticoccus sp. W117]MDM3871456.1 DUF4124 domain-containing protein [Porticoccus sp. W117]